MTTLMCNVSSCANNQDNACCLPGIRVNGSRAHRCSETCCDSFQKRTGSAVNAVGYASPSYQSEIRCEAENCVFYDANRCCADTISIDGGSSLNKQETMCHSFQPR